MRVKEADQIKESKGHKSKGVECKVIYKLTKRRRSDAVVASSRPPPIAKQQRLQVLLTSDFVLIRSEEDKRVIHHDEGAVKQRTATKHDRHRDGRLHGRHLVTRDGVEAQD